MVLVADSISFTGRHQVLVPKTTLRVAPGEVLLVVAEPQLPRTALALMLSGRMKPTSNTVQWMNDDALGALRRASAIIDSPKINEPEAHLKVCDVVSEDLALLPTPLWRRQSTKKWLAKHHHEDIAQEWIDAIDPIRRIELLGQLAAENPQTKLLVFDSPDRHGVTDEAWLQSLERYAYSRRNFAVIAVVDRVPECWQGPVSIMGNGDSQLQAPADPSPEPVESTDSDPQEVEHVVLDPATANTPTDAGLTTQAAPVVPASDEPSEAKD